MDTKRKIGILTFHRAVNYGAVLQAYALQKFMNQHGLDAEVIDYYNKKIEQEYRVIKIELSSFKKIVYNCLTMKERIKRKKAFANFIKKNIKVSRRRYSRSNIKDSSNLYSEFWVGSDQVWNLRLSNNDLTYLLDFCGKQKKCSYAASIGRSNLTEKEETIFKKHLVDYSKISLREQSGVQLLNGIIDNPMKVVVDPTLLFTKKQWEEISYKPRTKDDYILVYKITNSDAFEYADRLAHETKSKVVALQAPYRHMPKSFQAERYASPEEWIGWIQNAKYVVTDSFHATVFSIIFEKKFVSLIDKYAENNKNSRIIDVLAMCNLSSRLVNVADLEIIEKDIDYVDVKVRIKKCAEDSMKFILA